MVNPDSSSKTHRPCVLAVICSALAMQESSLHNMQTTFLLSSVSSYRATNGEQDFVDSPVYSLYLLANYTCY